MDDPEKSLRRWRRRAKATWWAIGGLVLIVLAAGFVFSATDDEDNIAVSRNEVVRGPGGERLWRGTFWNHSDSLYTDLDAVILFVDGEGRPLGQARGSAERLDPGEVFHIAARLPEGTAAMRVYQLRWRRYGGPRAVLGPYPIWPLGHVTDTECGPFRLRIGSCTPQRERQ